MHSSPSLLHTSYYILISCTCCMTLIRFIQLNVANLTLYENINLPQGYQMLPEMDGFLDVFPPYKSCLTDFRPRYRPKKSCRLWLDLVLAGRGVAIDPSLIILWLVYTYMVSIWIIYGYSIDNLWIIYGYGWWLSYPLKHRNVTWDDCSQ